jgi:hypothetical protein
MNSPCYIAFNLIGLVFGQWLVTRGHWAGFLVWCSCNIYGVIVCFTTGIPETSCLFGAYFVVNACSLFSWLGKTRASQHISQADTAGAEGALSGNHQLHEAHE